MTADKDNGCEAGLGDTFEGTGAGVGAAEGTLTATAMAEAESPEYVPPRAV